MISLRVRAIPQSTSRPFPKEIFLLGEFKALLNGLVRQLGIATRFKPRLYTYADFVMVKLYALAKGVSIHTAAETLNRFCILHFRNKIHLTPKEYCDNIRHRRLVPHQTDVDKFFRRLSEREVQNLFGNLNMALCRKIMQFLKHGQTWRFLVDNTTYPYYGAKTPPFDIGTIRHQGTRVCRMFQGHSLHGCDITLFYDFYLLRKGQYRSKSIPHSISWLKWNSIKVSYALMDREFYRAALIKQLKMSHIPVIIPAKKYPRVMRVLKAYLLRQGPMVSPYSFSQTPRGNPWPRMVQVHLVVVGHNDQGAWKIREAFWNRTLTFDEALRQLAVFFTTTEPWQNHRRWSKWLTRTYKKRWNQETGFRMLNAIHPNFRNRYPNVQLAQLHLRGMIYNCWQVYRKQGLKFKWKYHEVTLDSYKMRLSGMIEEEMVQNVMYNLKYLQKRKRRLYFGS